MRPTMLNFSIISGKDFHFWIHLLPSRKFM